MIEDIVQETYLRAVKQWSKNGLPNRPLAWLQTAAGYLVASHYRRVQSESSQDNHRAALQKAQRDLLSGRGGQAQLEPMRQDLVLAEKTAAGPERDLELRAAYLSGRRSAQEVMALSRLFQARIGLEAAEARRTLAQDPVASARDATGKGLGSPFRLKQAEFEFLAAEIQARLARLVKSSTWNDSCQGATEHRRK